MKRCILILPLLVSLSALSQILAGRFDSLTRVYEKNNFQGVVLVAKGDAIIYNNAWGYADMDKKIKLTTGSIFKTESVGKMFTAVAIMQLIEKGKLKTTQTIKELLPELALKNADKITVHHLLNHTSGLQSPWDHTDWTFKRNYSWQELEKVVTDLPLVFDNPGKEMYYSNSGYVILSWIIEKISGQYFDDYFAEQFFKPMQMVTVQHMMDTIMPAGEAQPYRFINSKKYIPQNDVLGQKANGAGGWLGTATDLYRFMLGLDLNKFISASTLNFMRTANYSGKPDSTYRYYAYGLETFNNTPIPGFSYFGHSGGGAGFSIDAIIEPVSHTIVIFCSNTNTNSRSVSSNYLRLALNQPATKVTIPNPVRLYDLIEEKGIADFINNEMEYFKSLDIIPDERIFTNVGDAMEMAGDFHTMTSWMMLGNKYFPENGFILLMAGSAELQTGQKDKAMKNYLSAKEIAVKKNDFRMLEEIEKRIKDLSN